MKYLLLLLVSITLRAQPIYDIPFITRSAVTNATLPGIYYGNGLVSTSLVTTAGLSVTSASTNTGVAFVGGRLIFSNRASLSGNQTLTTNQFYITHTSSGTLTLPACNTYSTNAVIIIHANASVACVIARAGSDTIDGATSESFTGPGVRVLYPDGVSNFELGK